MQTHYRETILVGFISDLRHCRALLLPKKNTNEKNQFFFHILGILLSLSNKK
jgi:hypothetical protein